MMIVDGVCVDQETKSGNDATKLIKSLSSVFNFNRGETAD